MYRIVWKEFSKSGKLLIKQKGFKDSKKREFFIAKLFGKENFHEIIAIK